MSIKKFLVAALVLLAGTIEAKVFKTSYHAEFIVLFTGFVGGMICGLL